MRREIYQAYIGTNTKCGSKGIYHIELDCARREIKVLHTHQILHGDYLALTGDEKRLYCVSEAVFFKGRASGGASAFRVERDGSLTLINSEHTGGQMSCFCAVDRKGETLYTSEYMGGTVTVFPVRPDGGLEAPAHVLGHRPRAGRHQPSVHSVAVTPDNRYILATDVGLDLVSLYDRQRGHCCVEEAQVPGRPRQAVFSPDGRFVYISTEQSGVIHCFRYSEDGPNRLTPVQQISTTPEGWTEYHAETSAIKISPDGRMLCVANRAPSLNDIACFRVDPETGRLETGGRRRLRGCFPRDFNFTPDGRYLLAAMQFSNQLELCGVDTQECRLTDLALFEGIPRGNCVQFLQGGSHEE